MSSKKGTKPIRMWIDGHSYIIKKFNGNVYKAFENSPTTLENRNVNTKNVSTKFQVPSFYNKQFSNIWNGFVNKIQSDTSSVISFSNKGEVEISGDSQETVDKAREELHSLIAELRENQAPRQFISIRLYSGDIKENFENFKVQVLAGEHKGVDESVFQKAIKLHLTACLFFLIDDKEKQVAIETLEECKNTLFGNRKNPTSPMKIKVKGVHCMNGNQTKANILYAEPDLTKDSESEMSLQEILNGIQNCFYEKGLVKGYQDNVKPHMTLMNTKYRNKKAYHLNKKKWLKREPFDATTIIEQFKDYEFGEVTFDAIHLSLMSDIDEDGFYKTIASIKI